MLGSAYRAFQSCGNPDLKPEKADTFNVGAILELGGFSATLDYFNFKFKDEITEESGARLYASIFPGGSNVNCGNPAFGPLQARFTFAGACGAANVAQLRRTSRSTGPTRGPPGWSSARSTTGKAASMADGPSEVRRPT